MNSETRMPASLQPRHRGGKRVVLAGGIEAALGGHFGAPLGNQAGGMRLVRTAIATISSVAAISKLSGLSISALSRAMSSSRDVAAILAQMGGDAVGAGRDRDLGRQDGIGMTPAARVAHGGDVVDVNAEANGRDRHA